MSYPQEGAFYKRNPKFVEEMKEAEKKSNAPYTQKSPTPEQDFATMPTKEDGGLTTIHIIK
jgi:hypothetical protein